MTSIKTNPAALAALSTLRSIDTSMEEVQRHVSSGYRVETAADNAAYWSIATTMRSDSAALATAEDALGLAGAKADTSYSGLSTAVEIMKTIKSKIVAANEPGVDKDKIDKELTELKAQLVSVSQSASFSGENWLYNDSTSAVGVKHMVGSFNRNSDGTVSIQTVDFDASTSLLIDKSQASRGLLTRDVAITQGTPSTTTNFFLLNVSSTTGATGTEIKLTSSTSAATVAGMLAAVEKMLGTLIDSASTLGATKSRIEQQTMFVKDLIAVVDKGVGRLVDADMNEESTRLKALQTQQQLGIQALSIANSNAQNLMALFRS